MNNENQHSSAPINENTTIKEWWLSTDLFGKFAYITLATLGVILRWANLGLRPLHHDEILHSVYSYNFSVNPSEQYYKYDPMLHGPVLYHVVSAIMYIFGATEFTARAAVAFLGSLFVFCPLLFVRYFSSRALIAITGLIGLSPLLVFFSRFIIHDYFLITATLLMFFGAFQAQPKVKGLLVVAAMALQLCVKQNCFVTWALIASYLVFEYLFIKLARISELKPIVVKMVSYLRHNSQSVLGGVLLGAFIFVFFYSAGFRDGYGLVNSPFTAGFSYWLNQNTIERIAGPFAFHAHVYVLYELVFVSLFAAHYIAFFCRACWPIRAIEMVAIFVGMMLYRHFSPESIAENPFWQFVKVKELSDVLFFVIVIGHGFSVTVQHLLNREQKLAGTGFFFLATLFTYSYLGEKVPWLSVYPLATGIVYLVMYFDNYFQKLSLSSWKECRFLALVSVGVCVILVVGFLCFGRTLFSSHMTLVVMLIVLLSFLAYLDSCQLLGRLNCFNVCLVICASFSLYTTLITTEARDGDASELVVQVHTTQEFRDLLLSIQQSFKANTLKFRPKVLAMDSASWPLFWYLRGYPVDWTAEPDKYGQYDMILKDGLDCDLEIEKLGFECESIKLNGWWLPNYREMTIGNMLGYAFTHKPFGYDPGFSYMVVYKKR